MKNLMGKCEYCGAEIGVIAESQAKANEEATRQCSCGAAKTSQKKKMFKENLKMYAGKNAEDEGFLLVESIPYGIIEDAGCAVIDGYMTSAVFKIDGTVISITNNGEKTKVKRKKTYEREEEIK